MAERTGGILTHLPGNATRYGGEAFSAGQMGLITSARLICPVYQVAPTYIHSFGTVGFLFAFGIRPGHRMPLNQVEMGH
jgi:hypothetical protein